MSIDDRIIDSIYQRLANLCADRFDRSCYWLAVRCALAGGTAMAVWLIVFDDGWWWWRSFLVMTQCAFAWNIHLRAERAERAWRAGRWALDTARLEDRGWRYFYLVVVAITIPTEALMVFIDPSDIASEILKLAGIVGIYSAFCFMACYPRSPRPKPARIPANVAMESAR